MSQSIKYLFNSVLIVVCTQFAFSADNAGTGGKQSYISFEDSQATLPDKEFYEAGNSSNSGGSRSAPDWEDNPQGYEAGEFVLYRPGF